MFKKKTILRFFAIITLFFYACADVYAVSPFASAPVNMPESIGRVKRVLAPEKDIQAAKKGTVLLIEDCHTSFSVQSNIKVLLKYIHDNYSFDTVYVEGSSGPVALEQLQSYPENKIKNKVSSFLLRKGYLSGGESFCLSGPNIDLIGVENTDDYLDNYNAYIEILKFSDEVGAYISTVRDEFESLLDDNAEVTQLYDLWRALDNGTVGVQDIFMQKWGQTILSEICSLSSDQDKPVLFLFCEILKTIASFNDVRLVGELTQVADKYDIDVDDRDTVRVVSECMLKQVDLDEYPELKKRYKAGKRLNSLDWSLLVDELKNAIENEMAVLFSNGEFDAFKFAWIAEKMSKQAAVVDEVSFFENYLQQNGFNGQKELNSFDLFVQLKKKEVFDLLSGFYSAVEKRNHSIVNNLEKEIRRSDKSDQFFPLIIGGYHSSAISSILRDRGYTVSVLTPALGDVYAENDLLSRRQQAVVSDCNADSMFSSYQSNTMQFPGFLLDEINARLANKRVLADEFLMLLWLAGLHDDFRNELLSESEIKPERVFALHSKNLAEEWSGFLDVLEEIEIKELITYDGSVRLNYVRDGKDKSVNLLLSEEVFADNNVDGHNIVDLEKVVTDITLKAYEKNGLDPSNVRDILSALFKTDKIVKSKDQYERASRLFSAEDVAGLEKLSFEGKSDYKGDVRRLIPWITSNQSMGSEGIEYTEILDDKKVRKSFFKEIAEFVPLEYEEKWTKMVYGQSSDPAQPIAEIFSNAIDSIMGGGIGRFGAGGKQIFREIEKKGDKVVFESSADGENGIRVIFTKGTMRGGESKNVDFQLMRIKDVKTRGIKVKVIKQGDLSIDRLQLLRNKIYDFFSDYEGLPIFINGKIFNALDGIQDVFDEELQYAHHDERVDINFYRNGYEITDTGKGMTEREVFQHFLNWKVSSKQKLDTLEKIRWKKRAADSDSKETVLKIKAGGVAFECFLESEIDLDISEMWLDLSSNVGYLDSRDALDVNDEMTVLSVRRLLKRMKDEFVLDENSLDSLRAFGLLLNKFCFSGSRNPELWYEVRDVITSLIVDSQNNRNSDFYNKAFFPSTSEYREAFNQDVSDIIFIEPELVDFTAELFKVKKCYQYEHVDKMNVKVSVFESRPDFFTGLTKIVFNNVTDSYDIFVKPELLKSDAATLIRENIKLSNVGIAMLGAVSDSRYELDLMIQEEAKRLIDESLKANMFSYVEWIKRIRDQLSEKAKMGELNPKYANSLFAYIRGMVSAAGANEVSDEGIVDSVTTDVYTVDFDKPEFVTGRKWDSCYFVGRDIYLKANRQHLTRVYKFDGEKLQQVVECDFTGPDLVATGTSLMEVARCFSQFVFYNMQLRSSFDNIVFNEYLVSDQGEKVLFFQKKSDPRRGFVYFGEWDMMFSVESETQIDSIKLCDTFNKDGDLIFACKLIAKKTSVCIFRESDSADIAMGEILGFKYNLDDSFDFLELHKVNGKLSAYAQTDRGGIERVSLDSNKSTLLLSSYAADFKSRAWWVKADGSVCVELPEGDVSIASDGKFLGFAEGDRPHDSKVKWEKTPSYANRIDWEAAISEVSGNDNIQEMAVSSFMRCGDYEYIYEGGENKACGFVFKIINVKENPVVIGVHDYNNNPRFFGFKGDDYLLKEENEYKDDEDAGESQKGNSEQDESLFQVVSGLIDIKRSPDEGLIPERFIKKVHNETWYEQFLSLIASKASSDYQRKKLVLLLVYASGDQPDFRGDVFQQALNADQEILTSLYSELSQRIMVNGESVFVASLLFCKRKLFELRYPSIDYLLGRPSVQGKEESLLFSELHNAPSEFDLCSAAGKDIPLAAVLLTKNQERIDPDIRKMLSSKSLKLSEYYRKAISKFKDAFLTDLNVVIQTSCEAQSGTRQMIFIRELVQNSRDVSRKYFSKVKDYFNKKGEDLIRPRIDIYDRLEDTDQCVLWKTEFVDYVGMDLNKIVNYLLPPETSDKDTEDAGGLGWGFYTVFEDTYPESLKAIEIETAAQEGKYYNIRIEKNDGIFTIVDWQEKNSQGNQGTVIRKIHSYEKGQVSYLERDRFKFAINMNKYLGHIKDVDVYYNDFAFNEQRPVTKLSTLEMGEWGNLDVRRSLFPDNVILLDQLYFQNISVDNRKKLKGVNDQLFGQLPNWLVSELTRNGGLELAVPRSIKPNGARTQFSLSDEYERVFKNACSVAVLHAYIMSCLAANDETVSDDLLRHIGNRKYQDISDDVKEVAYRINHEQYQNVDLELIGKNKSNWFDLMSLLDVRLNGNAVSLLSQRGEQYDEYKPFDRGETYQFKKQKRRKVLRRERTEFRRISWRLIKSKLSSSKGLLYLSVGSLLAAFVLPFSAYFLFYVFLSVSLISRTKKVYGDYVDVICANILLFLAFCLFNKSMIPGIDLLVLLVSFSFWLIGKQVGKLVLNSNQKRRVDLDAQLQLLRGDLFYEVLLAGLVVYGLYERAYFFLCFYFLISVLFFIKKVRLIAERGVYLRNLFICALAGGLVYGYAFAYKNSLNKFLVFKDVRVMIEKTAEDVHLKYFKWTEFRGRSNGAKDRDIMSLFSREQNMRNIGDHNPGLANIEIARVDGIAPGSKAIFSMYDLKKNVTFRVPADANFTGVGKVRFNGFLNIDSENPIFLPLFTNAKITNVSLGGASLLDSEVDLKIDSARNMIFTEKNGNWVLDKMIVEYAFYDKPLIVEGIERNNAHDEYFTSLSKLPSTVKVKLLDARKDFDLWVEEQSKKNKKPGFKEIANAFNSLYASKYWIQVNSGKVDPSMRRTGSIPERAATDMTYIARNGEIRRYCELFGAVMSYELQHAYERIHGVADGEISDEAVVPVSLYSVEKEGGLKRKMVLNKRSAHITPLLLSGGGETALIDYDIKELVDDIHPDIELEIVKTDLQQAAHNRNALAVNLANGLMPDFLDEKGSTAMRVRSFASWSADSKNLREIRTIEDVYTLIRIISEFHEYYSGLEWSAAENRDYYNKYLQRDINAFKEMRDDLLISLSEQDQGGILTEADLQRCRSIGDAYSDLDMADLLPWLCLPGAILGVYGLVWMVMVMRSRRKSGESEEFLESSDISTDDIEITGDVNQMIQNALMLRAIEEHFYEMHKQIGTIGSADSSLSGRTKSDGQTVFDEYMKSIFSNLIGKKLSSELKINIVSHGRNMVSAVSAEEGQSVEIVVSKKLFYDKHAQLKNIFKAKNLNNEKKNISEVSMFVTSLIRPLADIEGLSIDEYVEANLSLENIRNVLFIMENLPGQDILKEDASIKSVPSVSGTFLVVDASVFLDPYIRVENEVFSLKDILKQFDLTMKDRSFLSPKKYFDLIKEEFGRNKDFQIVVYSNRYSQSELMAFFEDDFEMKVTNDMYDLDADVVIPEDKAKLRGLAANHESEIVYIDKSPDAEGEGFSNRLNLNEDASRAFSVLKKTNFTIQHSIRSSWYGKVCSFLHLRETRKTLNSYLENTFGADRQLRQAA